MVAITLLSEVAVAVMITFKKVVDPTLLLAIYIEQMEPSLAICTHDLWRQ